MFSKVGTYPAVGMFSSTHIISIIVCFILVAVAVVLTRKLSQKTYFKILKVFTIVFTCTELFKIIWTLSNGQTGVNTWVPLYFCSIFIYSLWFTWAKNKFVKDMGLAYIAYACMICGAVFIVSPTTSFNSYPIFHFQCIYSMVYHSCMLYAGIMLHITKTLKVNIKTVGQYSLFCIIFMILGIIVNVGFDGNMMFLSNPSGIPMPFLFSIYNFSHLLYTLFIIFAHMLMGIGAWIIKLGYEFVREKLKKEINLDK